MGYMFQVQKIRQSASKPTLERWKDLINLKSFALKKSVFIRLTAQKLDKHVFSVLWIALVFKILFANKESMDTYYWSTAFQYKTTVVYACALIQNSFLFEAGCKHVLTVHFAPLEYKNIFSKIFSFKNPEGILLNMSSISLHIHRSNVRKMRPCSFLDLPFLVAAVRRCTLHILLLYSTYMNFNELNHPLRVTMLIKNTFALVWKIWSILPNKICLKLKPPAPAFLDCIKSFNSCSSIAEPSL